MADSKMLRPCFFTSIALNYTAKAFAWARSVASIYPLADVFIAVLDLEDGSSVFVADLDNSVKSIAGPRCSVVSSESLGASPEWRDSGYGVSEACTRVKPRVTLALLNRYSVVTYMDPDTILFADLDHIQNETGFDWDIQLSPHIIGSKTNIPRLSERIFALSGVYNLGYFSIRRSADSLRFLLWWDDYLSRFCYDYPSQGLFVDQKPVDFVHCFLDKVHILRHPGYNVAWWNLLYDRGLGFDADYHVVHDGMNHDLVFFHFSNLPSSFASTSAISKMIPMLTSKLTSELTFYNWPVLQRLYLEYSKDIINIQQQMPSSAGMLTTGSVIKQKLTLPWFKRILISEGWRIAYNFNKSAPKPTTSIAKLMYLIFANLNVRGVARAFKAGLISLMPSMSDYILHSNTEYKSRFSREIPKFHPGGNP